jgi:hypothetical protein
MPRTIKRVYIHFSRVVYPIHSSPVKTAAIKKGIAITIPNIFIRLKFIKPDKAIATHISSGIRRVFISEILAISNRRRMMSC